MPRRHRTTPTAQRPRILPYLTFCGQSVPPHHAGNDVYGATLGRRDGSAPKPSPAPLRKRSPEMRANHHSPNVRASSGRRHVLIRRVQGSGDHGPRPKTGSKRQKNPMDKIPATWDFRAAAGVFYGCTYRIKMCGEARRATQRAASISEMKLSRFRPVPLPHGAGRRVFEVRRAPATIMSSPLWSSVKYTEVTAPSAPLTSHHRRATVSNPKTQSDTTPAPAASPRSRLIAVGTRNEYADRSQIVGVAQRSPVNQCGALGFAYRLAIQ